MHASYNRARMTSDDPMERAMVARGLAYLFGLGGLLLLGTLLLPGAHGRHTTELLVVACVANVTALGLLAASSALPLSLLRIVPALGTIMVGFVIYFSMPAESAIYAIYVAWVLVAGALFLDARLVLTHGLLALVTCVGVLVAREPAAHDIELTAAMIGGTVLAMSLVIGALGRHVHGVVGRLEAAAHTDPLTGLLNRRAFDEAFARELGRVQRADSYLGVILLDIDGFKRFNDAHGHPEGDRALRRIGHVLSERTRAGDLAARIGGEEFALLVPESRTAGTLALAERLRRSIEVEFSADGGLTASCGVASRPEHGDDPSTLIAAADDALYEAKRSGRNQAVAAERIRPVLRAVLENASLAPASGS